MHPVRPFLADPNHGVEIFWLLVPSLNPIRLRGVFSPWMAQIRLGPAQSRVAVCEANELPHGVKGDLRVVRASLDGQVAAGYGPA